MPMEEDIKKLYISSYFSSFRTPWTKFEIYNPIVVGEDRFFLSKDCCVMTTLEYEH